MLKGRISFIISIVMLMVGMTVGFILLGTVYPGPRWVMFVVFLAYLLVSYLVIKFSKRYIQWLKSNEVGPKSRK